MSRNFAMARFNVVAVVMFAICHFGNCLSTGVERYYNLILINSRLSDWFSVYENVSRVVCFSHCAAEPSCFYGSYNKKSRACALSVKEIAFDSMVEEANDWYLYQLYEFCPGIGEDITTTASSHTIAICSHRLRQPDAERACASFGRLVEIRTEKMFHEIISYIMSLPQAMQDYYFHFWISGNYDSQTGTYIFPDGSPLQLPNDILHDIDGTSSCLRLKFKFDYKIDDTNCASPYSFICESI